MRNFIIFYSGYVDNHVVNGWVTAQLNGYVNADSAKAAIQDGLGSNSNVSLTNIIELPIDDYNQFIAEIAK